MVDRAMFVGVQVDDFEEKIPDPARGWQERSQKKTKRTIGDSSDTLRFEPHSAGYLINITETATNLKRVRKNDSE